MDNSILVALISAGGAVIAALIAIIPHQLKKRDQPPVAPGHGPTSRPADFPPRPANRTLPEPAQISEEEERLDETTGRRRREETIKVLFRHGCIQAGTEIEPEER